MQKDKIIEQINSIMHNEFEVPKEKLVPESNFSEDLEMDSLDAVDMLVHLEDTLNVKVNTEKFQNIKTLGDIYNIVIEIYSESSSPEQSVSP